MTPESFDEITDLWSILIKAAVAFVVAFAIVLGACFGLAAAGKLFPKSVKPQIEKVAQ